MIVYIFCYFHTVVAQEGPGIVIAHPGEDVELLCNVTGGTPTWIVNNVSYTLSELFTGQLAGHSSNGSNIIVEDIMMNDDRNGNMYTCVVPQIPPTPDIISSPTILCVAGEYTYLRYYIYTTLRGRMKIYCPLQGAIFRFYLGRWFPAIF